jgi:spore germination cell wall hydrolase CwlJ-like protein
VAAVAVVVLTGAAFADVMVSQSNSPSLALGAEIGSLLQAEHSTMNALPEADLTALAKGVAAKAAAPQSLPYSEDWLASLPAPKGDAQWDCLRHALYFEARGETIQGQFAVAEVILNRLDAAGFPKTVCGVIRQEGEGTCAFSFMCDGLSDKMRDQAAMERAGKIARLMLDGAPRPLTAGATFFHNQDVKPKWKHLTKTVSIGAHLFYRTTL